MASPSPFQTLPMLIVRKAVEYLEGRSRNSFDRVLDKHNQNKAILTPLISVSERWRTAALMSVCDNCELAFDHYSQAVKITYPAFPGDLSHLHVRKNGLVKRVIVSALLWGFMCDGRFCKTLATPQYESLVFPSANTLVLRLDKYYQRRLCNHCSNGISYPGSVIDEEMVVRFARSLLQLTPAATSIVVSALAVSSTHSKDLQLYDTLVAELCRNVHGLQICAVGSVAIPFSLRDIAGLTSLVQGLSMVCDPFVRLAYLNAATLRTLELEVVGEANWLAVIYGGTEIAAVYVNLVRLVLTFGDAPYSMTWAAIRDIAPFPVLSTLDVRNSAPFDDDLLFRGNGATLQNLRIPFRVIAKNILGRFDVLKRRGATTLNKVRIGQPSEADNAFMASNLDMSIEQQVHDILRVVTTLKLDVDTSGLHMLRAINAAPNSAILKHLVLANIKCTMDNIIQFIAALPSLISLSCEIQVPVSTVESIPISEHPSILYAKHNPLSSNFKSLSVPWDVDASGEKIAVVAVQLAAICPSFSYVDLSPKLRNAFGREVGWAALNKPFGAYAGSLTRLIYKY